MHLAQDNTDVQNASHAVGPTPTMLGPQLMSFSLLKSSLQCDAMFAMLVGIQVSQRFQQLGEQQSILALHTKEAIILEQQRNTLKMTIVATVEILSKRKEISTITKNMG